MNEEIKNIIILSVCFLSLFGAAEFLYHFGKIKVEVTRKIVHIGTGLLTLLFPVLLSSHWSVLFLCGSFFIILFCSQKFNFLKSINAIGRKSYGSLSYPVVVYVCFLTWEKVNTDHILKTTPYLFFYLPILIMAFADPAAAFAGKKFHRGVFKIGNEYKSLSGSFAFFLVAFIISICFLLPEYSLIVAMVIAAVIALTSAFTEAVSRNGWDNLSIPLCVLTVSYFLMFYI
ncbi:MAG: phosphatidate cytidylyltransferase [Fimbriimonadaceae bacterium]|nr:phosphatidate cytidylyltransferase [Chitinophagales bacterium]